MSSGHGLTRSVPKQASDSPNPINRNSTSVSTIPPIGHLQEACVEDCPVAVAEAMDLDRIRCMCVYYPGMYGRTLRQKSQAGT